MTDSTNTLSADETVTDLETEGDIAADYIEEFLDICDLDGDIDIDVRDGRAYLAVNSSDADTNLHTIAGHEAVAALQELARLAVQTKTGAFSRLILDVQGSRESRKNELSILVDEAISRIHAGTATVSLEPMSSYERKVVHDIVAERDFTSESDGQGKQRHVVISGKQGE